MVEVRVTEGRGPSSSWRGGASGGGGDSLSIARWRSDSSRNLLARTTSEDSRPRDGDDGEWALTRRQGKSAGAWGRERDARRAAGIATPAHVPCAIIDIADIADTPSRVRRALRYAGSPWATTPQESSRLARTSVVDEKKFPGGLVARSEPSAGNHSPGPRHFARRLRSDRPSSAPTPRSRRTSRESSHRAACADPSTVAGCLRRKRKTASCWAPASRASLSGSRARRPSPCTRSRRTSGAATRSWRIRCERLRARVIRLDERMSLRPPT